MFKKLAARYRANFALLREAADIIGGKFELQSYRDLSGGPLDTVSGTFEHQGVKMEYSANSFVVKKNGDIGFCIDIHSKLPTFLGVKPSYQFYKRENGVVYY